MPLFIRIAWRYIFFERKVNFISIITACSLLGITVGVAALICVTSIFNGFGDLLRTTLIGFDPHIRIIVGKDSALANRALAAARALPDVQAAAQIKQGKIIVTSNGGSMQVFMLNSAPTEDLRRISGVANSMVFGRFALDPVGGDRTPRIVLGYGVADKLRVIPGDSLRLYSPADIETAATLGTPPLGSVVRVAGIFQSNAREYDNFYIFGSDALGQKKLHGTAAAIDIKLNDINNVERGAATLRANLGAEVETWYDLHRDLYDVMKFERLAVFIIVSIIVCIAAFTILASLAMTVTQKRRDIGILRAMGASSQMIRRIFIAEGSLIGIISVISGCIIGLGLCFGQIYFGWLALDRSRYIVSAIPVSVHWPDVAAVCCVALVLALSATIYPANYAASQNISGAIREE
ncbi:ABC transporter permease [Ignavibacteria bacterium]|nr:ABC transporter permease [Bacteroidota bacterium]MCZ2133231.1 ABC transporter permease [Bacteroidota bacterium]